MGTAPAFASVGEAMEMARAALGYLAAADATQLAAETQAECLRGLERTDAISTAARASFLSAFTAGQGLLRRRGLQRAGLADAPAPGSPAARRPRTPRGPGGTAPIPGSSPRWPPGTCRSPTGGPSASGPTSCRRSTGTSPTSCWSRRRLKGWGWRTWSALFAEMYERARADLPDEDPAPGVRRPRGAAGDDVPGRGSARPGT